MQINEIKLLTCVLLDWAEKFLPDLAAYSFLTLPSGVSSGRNVKHFSKFKLVCRGFNCSRKLKAFTSFLVGSLDSCKNSNKIDVLF